MYKREPLRYIACINKVTGTMLYIVCIKHNNIANREKGHKTPSKRGRK